MWGFIGSVMTARNDITGDSITNNKGSHSKYSQGWELALGKKDKVCYNQPNPVEPDADGVSTFGERNNRKADTL